VRIGRSWSQYSRYVPAPDPRHGFSENCRHATRHCSGRSPTIVRERSGMNATRSAVATGAAGTATAMPRPVGISPRRSGSSATAAANPSASAAQAPRLDVSASAGTSSGRAPRPSARSCRSFWAAKPTARRIPMATKIPTAFAYPSGSKSSRPCAGSASSRRTRCTSPPKATRPIAAASEPRSGAIERRRVTASAAANPAT
jgi:hypothetical protein